MDDDPFFLNNGLTPDLPDFSMAPSAPEASYPISEAEQSLFPDTLFGSGGSEFGGPLPSEDSFYPETGSPETGGSVGSFLGSMFSTAFGIPDRVSTAFTDLDFDLGESVKGFDVDQYKTFAEANAINQAAQNQAAQTELARTQTARLNDPFYKQEWFWRTVLGFGALYLQFDEQDRRRDHERDLLKLQLADKQAARDAKYASYASTASGSSKSAVGATRGEFTNYSGG